MRFHQTTQGVCVSVLAFSAVDLDLFVMVCFSAGDFHLIFSLVFLFSFSPPSFPLTIVSQLYLDVSTGNRYSFPLSISTELSVTTE